MKWPFNKVAETLNPSAPTIQTSTGQAVEPRMVDLQALIDSQSIDLVDFNDSSIVVVDKHALRPTSTIQLADADASDLRMNLELGRSTTAWSSFLREEYLPELRDQQGLIKYDRMRRSDAAVRSALRTLKTPILGAGWYIQPFDESKQSQKRADFVWDNFTKHGSYGFANILQEALLMLEFGFWIDEKVWDIKEIDGKEMVILRKLASRHPLDVVGWGFDENGGPAYVDFYNSPGTPDHVRIGIDKLAIFTFDGEAGDLRGISVLRSAYKHWYFKENLYKIDAIQKERHGIGIPIIKLPPGFTPSDRDKAHELGENLRTNEKAHVVLPPFWEILFAKLEGQPVSPMESANHHVEMIYQNVLSAATYAKVSGGEADVMMELFYKSTRHIADLVRSVFNKYVIPQLYDWNWEDEKYPELRVRRLGDTNEARTTSFALRNFVGGDIVRPDDALEEWARDLIDAPKADPSTRRKVATPQLPKPVENQQQPRLPGQSKQAPAAGGMQQGKQPGAGNAGQDTSGGGK